ncbi:hypothetical protein ABW19_dt0205588 [Dactylella cylindrospora]|nr:hypothetical protein ABW19_dt0205588 [Dactylella cylindrospora]
MKLNFGYLAGSIFILHGSLVAAASSGLLQPSELESLVNNDQAFNKQLSWVIKGLQSVLSDALDLPLYNSDDSGNSSTESEAEEHEDILSALDRAWTDVWDSESAAQSNQPPFDPHAYRQKINEILSVKTVQFSESVLDRFPDFPDVPLLPFDAYDFIASYIRDNVDYSEYIGIAEWLFNTQPQVQEDGTTQLEWDSLSRNAIAELFGNVANGFGKLAWKVHGVDGEIEDSTFRVSKNRDRLRALLTRLEASLRRVEGINGTVNKYVSKTRFPLEDQGTRTRPMQSQVSKS